PILGDERKTCADTGPGIPGERRPVERNGARGSGVDPEDYPGEFRPAGPHQSEEAEYLTRVHPERDVLDHPGLAEALDAEDDIRRGHGGSRRIDVGKLTPDHRLDHRLHVEID